MNTRHEIAENLGNLIAAQEAFKAAHGYSRKLYVGDICEELSIFDWWNDYMSLSQLKQMQKFLETAEKLGYNGYVCFKVGAKYCSNGMWAHKEESTDGYSPNGECLYHSFVSGRNDWDVKTADGKWMHETTGDTGSLKDVQSWIEGRA